MTLVAVLLMCIGAAALVMCHESDPPQPVARLSDARAFGYIALFSGVGLLLHSIFPL